MSGLIRSRAVALLAGTTAAVAAGAARRWLGDRPPGGAARWTRTNHHGDPVTLLEGPAYVVGACVGAVAGGAGPVLATIGGGVVGLVDDLGSDTTSKGFRGHLAALREGRVTTGVVKIVGLAATGVVATAVVDRGRGGRGAVGVVVDTLLGGAVVAGSANLVNLFDLRPGRALKVVLLTAAPAALGPVASPAAAAALGAAGALLPEDLRGESMLGDTGANAAGALLGTVVVGGLARPGRVAVLTGLAALTAASERVSFTRVIESTPGLRRVDAWGRS